MNIVCVGDCGVDHYLPDNLLLGGGITANFARQARKALPATDEVLVITAVGNDRQAANLARSGVERPGIRSDITIMDGGTPVQFIEIAPGGERRFVYYDEGVLRHFRIDSHHAQDLAAADLLVTPVFQQIRGLFDSVMTAPRPATTAVDFADFANHPDFDHLEFYLDKFDIAFFGLTIDQATTIERLRNLAAAHDKLLVVTLGADGSRAFHGGIVYERAAVPVSQVVDTTGAGDAFAAGFLSLYVHGATVDASLACGAQLAADTVQYQGAVMDR